MIRHLNTSLFRGSFTLCLRKIESHNSEIFNEQQWLELVGLDPFEKACFAETW